MTTVRPMLYKGGDNGTPTDQENRVASQSGGRRVPGSGASSFAKGDVKAPGWLIECKKTEHASLSVKKAWLVKVSREAVNLGREPALAIEIQGGVQDPVCERDWVAIPLRVFRHLVDAMESGRIDGI